MLARLAFVFPLSLSSSLPLCLFRPPSIPFCLPVTPVYFSLPFFPAPQFFFLFFSHLTSLFFPSRSPPAESSSLIFYLTLISSSFFYFSIQFFSLNLFAPSCFSLHLHFSSFFPLAFSLPILPPSLMIFSNLTTPLSPSSFTLSSL